jgi:hypothetical protein
MKKRRRWRTGGQWEMGSPEFPEMASATIGTIFWIALLITAPPFWSTAIICRLPFA